MATTGPAGVSATVRPGGDDLPPARQPDYIEQWLTDRGRREPAGGQDGAVRSAWALTDAAVAAVIDAARPSSCC